MFWRALLAFLALPGVVAYLVPAAWLWRSTRASIAYPSGITLLCAGTVGLLWCVRDFYVQGKGTLAPWAPPQSLVVVGLYRLSRNPMYLCVLTVLAGWAITFASGGLGVYAACIAAAFHLRVVLGEEPWLLRRHGAIWSDYVQRVPRWVGPVKQAGRASGDSGSGT